MSSLRPLLLAGVAVVVIGCGGKADEGEEGRIVFSSARDGDFEIYVMDGDGGGIEQLTRNESSGRKEGDDYAPAWSPDGTTIAFTSTRDHDGDGFDSNELYVMDASGADQTRLTENALGEGSPRWSPDGESIVLIRRREPDADRFEVAVGSRDGSGLETVLENGELVLSVDWSPDGTMIALTSCADAFGDCEIWIAGSDGLGARRLTHARGRSSDPEWSPDGSRIAFVSDRDRNGRCLFRECTGHNGEIYVMNADGSGQTRLTDDAGDDRSPTWSPDGTKIAFSALRDVVGAVDEEDYDIYVMDDAGRNLRRLTDDPAFDVEPDWR